MIRRRQLVDIDLGIGREFGYNNPAPGYPIGQYDGEPRRSFIPATCHPGRQHEAHGMCKTCYKTWSNRAKRVLRGTEMWPTTPHKIGSIHGENPKVARRSRQRQA